MSGLFDELVQNEVNRVHNEFARERDELPVVGTSLLMERRKHYGAPLGVTKGSATKTRQRIAKNIGEIEGIAKSIGHDALDKNRVASIQFKDSIRGRLYKMKDLVEKIDSEVRGLSTEEIDDPITDQLGG